MKSLRRVAPEYGVTELEVFGIGGKKLRAEGQDIVFQAEKLLSMGFVEVLARLPNVFKALWRLSKEVVRRRPHFAIVLDYPDFHFRLSRFLFRKKIPVVYWIPPKVWAWRTGRVEFLRKTFQRVFCILPFEVDFYKRHHVSQARYVGNPLLEELPLQLTKSEARKDLGLTEDDLVLTLMPGSRPSELKYHLEIMIRAAISLDAFLQNRKNLPLKVFIALADSGPGATPEIKSQVESLVRKLKLMAKSNTYFKITRGNAHQVMVASDAGMIKSGTSTLEAGVLGLPHVVAYRSNWVSQMIFKYFVRYRGPVGLVNLITHFDRPPPYPIPELLGPSMTEESIVHFLLPLFDQNSLERKSQVLHLAEVRRRCVSLRSPSEEVAREVFAMICKDKVSP